jgi:hypothetical protein
MGLHPPGLSAQLDSHLLKSSLRILVRNSNHIHGLLNSVFRFRPGHSFCFFRKQKVMSVKRFLILSSLIAFVTVSCAGPNKTGWTKPGFPFYRDQFEKDRKQCIQTLGNSLDSEAFGKALEECLAKKGYTYETVTESSFDKKDTAEAEAANKVLLGIAVAVVLVALIAVLIAVGEPRGIFGTFERN